MAKASQPTHYYATGKRKTSAARVYLRSGSGKFSANSMPLDKYLPAGTTLIKALAPLASVEGLKSFDADIHVMGGGKGGQAGAIAHGIARALLVLDNEKYRPLLKKAGHLTRDDRMVERKKYGQHKARKKTQFSKR